MHEGRDVGESARAHGRRDGEEPFMDLELKSSYITGTTILVDGGLVRSVL